MTDTTKLKTGSPEWLLEQNVKSEELKAIAFAKDADRYTKLAAEARERADDFRRALAALTAISTDGANND